MPVEPRAAKPKEALESEGVEGLVKDMMHNVRYHFIQVLNAVVELPTCSRGRMCLSWIRDAKCHPHPLRLLLQRYTREHNGIIQISE